MRELKGDVRERQPFSVRASRMVQTFLAEDARGVMAALAAGLFMAFAGPFGTIAAPLSDRLLYWLPTMLFGSIVGILVTRQVMKRPKIGDSNFALWLTTTLVITPPIALFVWWYAAFIFGWRLGGFMNVLPSVLLVSAAMTGIMIAAFRPGVATHAPPPEAPAWRVRFLDRLTPKVMGGEIYAVAAEDHYLRIYTSKGDDLILMRLSDAIAELEGIEGAQTHRSWWVAKAAVAKMEREGAKTTLRLRNGTLVPVSRANVKPLRDAGWR